MTSKRLLLLILLTVVVFVGLFSYGDFRDIGGELSRFPLVHLLATLGLALVNYALRFLRWSYYLHFLKIPVPFVVSALVFLAGLAMAITPGKAGELIKSYLLRDRVGVPVAETAPVVVMERLTDVISVVLLALLGLALLPLSVLLVLAVVLVLISVLVALIVTQKGDWFFEVPLIRRWSSGLRTSVAGMRQLASPRPMTVAVILGAGAWFSEGLALWVVLEGLDAHVSLLRALSIYAAATLVGAVSALPGGLVGTEGSMLAMLQQSGLTRGAATAGTLLVRLVTLWFAVALGLVALLCLNRMRPGLVQEQSGPDHAALHAQP
ncbi:MAG: hypothetical protein BZY81_01180 [SAR202 cluster bacterium Io17-Chloro-G4]|nr:MAG: hypothetical protein BZY81_01180 [SAR202 cluster bacterium Io17-Chloro-G4]